MGCQCKEYANIFKVLSDDTRIYICRLIGEKEVCGCDLLEKLNITQPTLSYHMKQLCEAGIVNGRKDGAWMRYTLNTEKFIELEDFLKSLRTATDEI